MAKVDIGGTIIQIGDDKYIPTEDEVRQVAFQAGLVTEEQSATPATEPIAPPAPTTPTNKYAGLSPADAFTRFGKDVVSSVAAVPQALQPRPTGRLVQDVLAGAGAGAMGAFGPGYEFANQLKNRAIIGNIVNEETSPQAYALAGQLTDPRNYALTMQGISDPMPMQTAQNTVKSTMSSVIRPSVAGKNNSRLIKQFEDGALEAVQTIIDNADGPLPKTLDDFTDSIYTTKRKVWSEVQKRAEKASYANADVTPVINELTNLKKSKIINAPENKSVLSYIDDEIEYLKNTQLTASDLLERVSSINAGTKGFFANANASSAMLVPTKAMVANRLNTILENQVSRITGSGVAQLKKQYGALTSIEKDVARRSFSESRGTGIADSIFDLASANDVINFLSGGGPASLVKASLIQGSKKLANVMRSPDRAISNMFKRASILKRQKQPVETQALIGYEPPPAPLRGLPSPPQRMIAGPKTIKPQFEQAQLPGPMENPFVKYDAAEAAARAKSTFEAFKAKYGTAGMPGIDEQRWYELHSKSLGAVDEEMRQAIELAKKGKRPKNR